MEQALAWCGWPDSLLLDQSFAGFGRGGGEGGGQGDTLVSLPGIEILQGEAMPFCCC